MDSQVLSTLFGHNLWATDVLLRRCRTLTSEQFHQRFEIGLGSLHDTLRHIIGAMLRWADRIGERPLRDSIEKSGRTYSPDELRELLRQAHEDLFGVVRRVAADGRLNEKMQFVAPDTPAYTFTRCSAIVHVATHGMHHRAQALNMLRRLGLPPLEMDLDTVEWECVRMGQFKETV
jgi:uncharacterized damage-inducible protein DinB